MKTDNLTWANDMIRCCYPGWIGLDDRMNTRIREYIPDCGNALDIGCGKHSPLGDYRNRLNLLVGTDLELKDIKENVGIKVLTVADGTNLPFASGLFDLIISKTVIEHVVDPLSFFKEAHRVLKPGGGFVWATSNLRAFPILASALTPLGVHKWVYRQIFGSSLDVDQFPTYYRANTKKTLGQQLTQAGFAKVAFYSASWPQYFAFSRCLFRFFLPLHRLSDWLGLEFLQAHLIGVYRKDS